MAAAEWDLGAEIDRLYGLPPEAFVDGREALARRLRAERRRDEAKEVHALRKPSRAAWAINHVAREEPQLAAEAVAAGDALREAQLALAGSGGPDALRAAASAQRAAVDRFSQAARETLAGGGLSGEDLLGRIGETLLAAATDPDLAERVGAGRVVKEQAPVGFGALAAGPGPLVPATSKRGKSAARSKDRPDARAARAADEEARRRTEAAREEEEHRRAESQARVRDARAGEARAHEEAAQLEAALDKARGRGTKARDALDRAQRKVDEAEREAADLEGALGEAQGEAARASALLHELEAEAAE